MTNEEVKKELDMMRRKSKYVPRASIQSLQLQNSPRLPGQISKTKSEPKPGYGFG